MYVHHLRHDMPFTALAFFLFFFFPFSFVGPSLIRGCVSSPPLCFWPV